jgi:aminomethyltransferase
MMAGVCGLGARDTLRTEMGYPLHGHELSLEITPVQASSSWAVVFFKERLSWKIGARN